MATKLDKTIKRELELEGKLYTVTMSPEGVKITPKGARKGQELTWANQRLAGGGAAGDPAGLAAGDRLGLQIAWPPATGSACGSTAPPPAASPPPSACPPSCSRPVSRRRPGRADPAAGRGAAGCVPAQGPRGPAHRSDVIRLRRRARRDGPHTRPGQANFGRFPHCGGIDTDDSVPAPSSPAVRKVIADAP